MWQGGKDHNSRGKGRGQDMISKTPQGVQRERSAERRRKRYSMLMATWIIEEVWGGQLQGGGGNYEANSIKRSRANFKNRSKPRIKGLIKSPRKEGGYTGKRRGPPRGVLTHYRIGREDLCSGNPGQGGKGDCDKLKRGS